MSYIMVPVLRGAGLPALWTGQAELAAGSSEPRQAACQQPPRSEVPQQGGGQVGVKVNRGTRGQVVLVQRADQPGPARPRQPVGPGLHRI